MNWHDEADILEQNGMHGYLVWAFEQHDSPNMSDAPTWLQTIATQHPTDSGLRVAPLLHYVTLKPGEAICLPAGNLHAYLHGFGLEITERVPLPIEPNEHNRAYMETKRRRMGHLLFDASTPDDV
jgi:D-lyxose ketol-isomerase